MRKCLLLICTIALCACNSEQPKNINTSDECAIRIDVDEDIEKNMQSIHDIAYDWSVIELEDHDDAMIDQISEFEIVDDKIICYSYSFGGKVVVFDINGKYLYNIGNRGPGPNEWVQISSMFVNKLEKTITLLDADNPRVFIYNLDGSLSNIYRWEDKYVYEIAHNNGIFYYQNTVLYNGLKLDKSFTSKVKIYNSDLKLLSLQVPYKWNDLPLYTGNKDIFKMNFDNNILCCPIGDEYIYKVSGDSIHPYVQFNYLGNKRFRSNEELNEFAFSSKYENCKNGMTFYSNYFIETDSLIYRRMGYYEAFDILYNKETNRVVVTEFDSDYLNRYGMSKNILYPSPEVFYDGRFYARFVPFIFDAPEEYMKSSVIPECLNQFKKKYDKGKLNQIIITYKLKI
ncbi:MAG TPA: hypothetical protein DCF91_08470 [Porphyromonadaceae bacterium]|nr:hypothetical protein [Porphyromonadaceae bacterium]